MGLKVLITNFHMHSPGGTEVYVRDLALELLRQGHTPAVYTPRPGAFCASLPNAGVPVFSDLRRFKFRPHIIHGHHKAETLAILEKFPAVPAIYICHDHTHFVDGLLVHPRIYRHFAVSGLCAERLVREGLAAEKVGFLPNFVDTDRFAPRPPLPDRPRRALLFSNYAKAETHLPAVTEACRRIGLPLDVIGIGVGNSLHRPETVIGRYDIVFAKAKAAMEAMAVGAAVVLCDFGGVGPMVTCADIDRLRPLNFGFQSLTEPLEAENIMAQIARYDPREAAAVRDRIRAEARLDSTVKTLAGIYKQVIKEHKAVYPLHYRTLISIVPPIGRKLEKRRAE